MTRLCSNALSASAAFLFFACGGAAGQKATSSSHSEVETESSGEKTTLDSNPATLEVGSGVYKEYCSFCHGDGGEGAGNNPPLIGDGALSDFKDYQAVLDYVSKEMPEDDPGTLSSEEYRAVVSFLRAQNGGASAVGP